MRHESGVSRDPSSAAEARPRLSARRLSVRDLTSPAAASPAVLPAPQDAVPFNRATLVGRERDYVAEVLAGSSFASIGPFNRRCQAWFAQEYPAVRTFLTGSCTHALETAALATGIGPGDEVILPSFTFTSTATAFARTGARLVFVDIDPATMNIDPACVAAAVTGRTRALVVMHYAGVGCDMDRLAAIADKHRLWLVEDAAQALLCTYKGRPLGTIGQFGAFSFHETKNIHSGEGGALMAAAPHALLCETILEKGTNRARFLRGEVDKYTWETLGSSYALPELPSALLLGQLEAARQVIARRLELWTLYREALRPLAEDGRIELPPVPEDCRHNAHILFFKCADTIERQALIDHLKANGVQATFHYVPLHSAPAGRRLGVFAGEDRHTTRESDRLLRLPLFHGLREQQVLRVADLVTEFYRPRRR
ncbi:dTDP-4-amino-4,6-dideoxygalactose transaminase [Novispirillum sp. DQ9]|uniref:dTDP-4-amino-4,6-dideoxygalactose transaminase n=1 Tax=Novispirillum sp. DQ9 TaxID=3398612 RepID=UPI003C7CD7AB